MLEQLQISNMSFNQVLFLDDLRSSGSVANFQLDINLGLFNPQIWKINGKSEHMSFAQTHIQSPTLQDPEQNKIFQWLEVTSKHGIVQLSFPLISEPILGSYHITVEKKSGEKEYQFFTVEEYGKQRLWTALHQHWGWLCPSQIGAASAEFKCFEFSTSCLRRKDLERAGWRKGRQEGKKEILRKAAFFRN